MKDSIVFILELPLKIYVFGHIYLFWVNRLYPALQKHYLNAKRDVAARGKVHLTSKSNLPNLEQHLIMSNSNSPFWKSYLFMPISLTPVWKIHLFTSNSHFPIWKIHLFMPISLISVWRIHFFTSNSHFPIWKKHFFMSKSVFAAVLIFIIKTWNRVYVHPQIYCSTSKSLSIIIDALIKRKELPETETNLQRFQRITGIDPCRCAVCKKGTMVRIRELPRIRSPAWRQTFQRSAI